MWRDDIPLSVRKNARKILEDSLDELYYKFCMEMDLIFEVSLEQKPKIVADTIWSAEGMILPEMGNRPLTIKVSTNYWRDVLGFDCHDCFQRWIKTREFILGHEIGHLYHIKVNPNLYDKIDFDERRGKGDSWFLGEVVAELSSMIYFNKKESLREIADFAHCGRKVEFNLGSMVYNVLLDNENQSNLLLNYLSKCNTHEGNDLLKNYKKYLRNPFASSFELYFGMCTSLKEREKMKQLILSF